MTRCRPDLVPRRTEGEWCRGRLFEDVGARYAREESLLRLQPLGSPSSRLFPGPLPSFAPKRPPKVTLCPVPQNRGSATQGVGGGHLVKVAWASRKDRRRLSCQHQDDSNRSPGRYPKVLIRTVPVLMTVQGLKFRLQPAPSLSPCCGTPRADNHRSVKSSACTLQAGFMVGTAKHKE